jgi:hypothetical protein
MSGSVPRRIPNQADKSVALLASNDADNVSASFCRDAILRKRYCCSYEQHHDERE